MKVVKRAAKKKRTPHHCGIRTVTLSKLIHDAFRKYKDRILENMQRANPLFQRLTRKVPHGTELS